MCGIAGYISRDGKRPAVTKKQLQKMLRRAESRGKDATGIFWDTGDTETVFKLPVPAKSFEKFVPWENVIKSPICLMHTRKATQGDPETNTNNHPLIDTDLNLVLIHNGVISNSSEYVTNKITDTYALFEAYAEYKTKSMVSTVKRTLKHLSGTMACALYHRDEKRLVLWKAGSPMAIGFKKNTLFFASTTHILSAVNPNSMFLVPENYLYSIKDRCMKGSRIKIKENEVYYGQEQIEWDF